MPKTIKQIADELGVSKQRVYRFIKQNCINEAHQNRINDTVIDAVIELLREELRETRVPETPL